MYKDEGRDKIKVLLLGIPNTGKTSVFNNLTGHYNIVANYPQTTIEPKSIEVTIKEKRFTIIDTPGLYSLFIQSEEEIAIRNLIFRERPDIIIQCADSDRLKQSIMLTLDLLELDIPLILVLNSIDITTRKGIWINTKELSRLLGVEVIESIAIYSKGTDEIKTALFNIKPNRHKFEYSQEIEAGISKVASMLHDEIPYRRKMASLLLMDDTHMLDYLSQSTDKSEIERLKDGIGAETNGFYGKIGRVMSNSRSRTVDDITERTVSRLRVNPREFGTLVAKLSRHPVYGIPIALGLIGVLYFLVVNVAKVVGDSIDLYAWQPIFRFLAGILPRGLVYDFLIGDYGVLTLGLANAIITILPILMVFYLVFNILEDVGYIPNLSVLSKRLWDRFGLSGTAICPLILALGCKTMATLTTKSISSPKEKFIAIYIITFGIPCGAQLGVNLNILGKAGISALLITMLFMIVVNLVIGLSLNKILVDNSRTAYMQVLPSIRMPDAKAVLKKTYFRLLWFLEEALPVFIYVAVALFVCERLGILSGLKKLLAPLIENFLGFPDDMLDVLIVCIARKEVAASMIIKLADKGLLNYVQTITAAIIVMLIPCIANIGAVFKELDMKRSMTLTASVYIAAFLLSGMMNHLLRIAFH